MQPDFVYRRVYLRTWPDLIGMPADQLPVVARICALVGRKPTMASLIPLILGLPKADVFVALERLREQACVQMPEYGGGALPGTPAAANDGADLPDTSQEHIPMTPGFMAKLWARLNTMHR